MHRYIILITTLGMLIFADCGGETVPVCDPQVGCDLDGACYPNGASNPANPCQVCDLAQSPTSWSDNDGVFCNDGLYCNGTDSCAAGTCSAHSGDVCPDDGLHCNGTESCSEDDDACEHSGNPCQAPQLCDDQNDSCVQACTGCTIGGVCFGDQQVNPQNICLICDTGHDVADWSNNDGAACSDGAYCNGADTCLDGACSQHSGDPCLDDGDPCNGDEFCNESEDSCDHSGGNLPDTPTGPDPAHESTDLDTTEVKSLDWADTVGATHYAVYVGTLCPPPAYPHPAFVSVIDSGLEDLQFETGTDYCWQVAAFNDDDCVTFGPVWSFATASGQVDGGPDGGLDAGSDPGPDGGDFVTDGGVDGGDLVSDGGDSGPVYSLCDPIEFPGTPSKFFDLQFSADNPHTSPYGTIYDNAFSDLPSIATALIFFNPLLQASLENPLPMNPGDRPPYVLLSELMLSNPASPPLGIPFRTSFYEGSLPAIEPPGCAHPSEPSQVSELCDYLAEFDSFHDVGGRCIPIRDFPQSVISEKMNIDESSSELVLDAARPESVFAIAFLGSFTGSCDPDPASCLLLHDPRIEALFDYQAGLGLFLGGLDDTQPKGVLQGVVCRSELAESLELLYWEPAVNDYRQILKTLKCDLSCECQSDNPVICPGSGNALECDPDCSDIPGDVEGVCPADEPGSPDGLSIVYLFHSGPGNIAGAE
jgi:hypothetical protein